MPKSENKLFQQVRSMSKKISVFQQMAIFGSVVVVLVALFGIITLANKPTMGVLFSNLSPQAASQIVKQLIEGGVPFEFDDAGRTILVPQGQIHGLRLSLAGSEISQSNIIGYEVLDRAHPGASGFVQRMNHHRAIEGELARTIAHLDGVESAKVQIVTPDRSRFDEDAKAITASAVLKLEGSTQLRRDAVEGICHLIASGVEGLNPENVKILDSQGTLLSNNLTTDPIDAPSQYELQQKVESSLAQKATSILEGVVGQGNAIVQVSAEIDLRKAKHILVEFNGKKSEAVNDQRIQKQESESSFVPTSERASVYVQRISVAVLVNGSKKLTPSDGEKTTEYTPRSQEELGLLTEVVKKAVGFNSRRNDEISVVNMPFIDREDANALFKDEGQSIDFNDILQKLVLIGAMVAAVFLLNSLMGVMFKKVVPETLGPGFAAFGETGVGRGASHVSLPHQGENQVSSETVSRKTRQRIETFLKEKPMNGALLLKMWLSNEE